MKSVIVKKAGASNQLTLPEKKMNRGGTGLFPVY